MRRWQRALGKWSIFGLFLLLFVSGLYVTALAYPTPLFHHKGSFEEYTVYSSRPLPGNLAAVIDEVRDRVEAMDYARPGAACRVFICGDERLYSIFAFLTRRSPESMGIGLSVFRTMYLNESRILRVRASNDGTFRHSRFEGNLEDVMAHEIAHFNVVDKLGFRAAIGLPVWKSEGYADYQTHLAATRADISYDFSDRIDLMVNDAFWGYEKSLARRLFEWHTLVEYLAEVKGYGLQDLVRESVTEAGTRAEMLAWYRDLRAAG